MAGINKRDLILNSIIEAYLSENLPIGSHELGSRMSVSIPASTIRVYFKKLSDEGEITQLHISGGRVPTFSAMYRYWYERESDFLANNINIKSKESVSNLINLAYEYDLYCMLFASKVQNLKNLTIANDRFIILEFDDDELVLKYDLRVYKFLSNLIGVNLDQLETFVAQVGLSELRVKIRELKRSKIYVQENEKVALQSFGQELFRSMLEPSFVSNLRYGINMPPIFNEGLLALKLTADYMGNEATLLCAGSVYSDYASFVNQIKEAA